MSDTFCEQEKNAFDHRYLDDIEAGRARQARERRAMSNEAFLVWLEFNFGVKIRFDRQATAEQEEVVMDALKEKFGPSFRIAVREKEAV